MLTFNDKTITYDNNGNMTSITNSCGTTNYTWDARNRLTGINGFNSDCSVLSASFKYDALGRRIEKTINSRTIQYLYDRLDIVQEIEGGTVTANYIRTLNIKEPLALINKEGIYYYTLDGLGSVIGITDQSGNGIVQYTYDPYGNTATNNPAFKNPFQYTGQENDYTGLYYYGARYYSPELQRFISEDPIGFAGGDVNLYRYVGNNPVNFVDPLGLFDITVGNRKWRYRPSDHHGVNPPEVHLDTVDSGPKKKLGAETGKVYDSKGKTVCGKISKKDFARVQSKLQKLGYLGMALTVYGVYESMTADEAQALEDLLNILESIPKDRGERMLKEIIENNPDKFQEVKP